MTETTEQASRHIPSLTADQPVFLFSGQGSQKPGMGADLFDIPEINQTLSCASDVLGYDVANLILIAEPEKLNDTHFAQPALCALSVSIAHALIARGIEPGAVLGFSLGQVSALPISGMLSDEDTFAFVKARADYMAQAAQNHPGAMSALLKAEAAAVLTLCEEQAQGDVLVAANYNCPGQIVISGTTEAIARAETAWAESGKRFSHLATSGAFHSPLMQDAADQLDAYLQNVTFADPRIPLICNVDALPLTQTLAHEHLVEHLTHPVRFDQSVQALAQAGAQTFIEVGFGGVLVGLVRRIDKTLERINIQDRASFDELVNSVRS